METSNNILLLSVMLNALAFFYGCILMIAKSVCRKQKRMAPKNEPGRFKHVDVRTNMDISAIGHVVSKSVINIAASLIMVGMSLFIIVNSDVPTNPFFAYNASIMFNMIILLGVCIFNMVLTLLTETLSKKNIHEIPLYMVTSLISVTILYTKENAILGVVCLLMFGSVFADELMHITAVVIYSKHPKDSSASKNNICYRLTHVFRLIMHLLCNFVFPAILFIVPTCFSTHVIFDMNKPSIIIFFLAVTFLVFCNLWRLKTVIDKLRMAEKKEHFKDNSNSLIPTDIWHTNNISTIIIPIAKNKFVQLIQPGKAGIPIKALNDYMISNNIKEVSHINIELPTKEPISKEEQLHDTANLEAIDINKQF